MPNVFDLLPELPFVRKSKVRAILAEAARLRDENAELKASVARLGADLQAKDFKLGELKIQLEADGTAYDKLAAENARLRDDLRAVQTDSIRHRSIINDIRTFLSR